LQPKPESFSRTLPETAYLDSLVVEEAALPDDSQGRVLEVLHAPASEVDRISVELANVGREMAAHDSAVGQAVALAHRRACAEYMAAGGRDSQLVSAALARRVMDHTVAALRRLAMVDISAE